MATADTPLTQNESGLIQKIYTHFKKAPATHKLGVLYVVDSVTRKWLEQAKANGQAIGTSAQDGTYAGAVHRVTELMPVLMNDITHSAPSDQKVRSHHTSPCPDAAHALEGASPATVDSWTPLRSPVLDPSHQTYLCWSCHLLEPRLVGKD
jgi:hypothetical protein